MFVIFQLLFVYGILLPATFAITKITCSDQTTYISCPDGKLINIISANYGRTQPGSVACKMAGVDTNTNCIDQDATAIMSDWCNGLEACSAQPIWFGDTCFGTYKYINVTYTCVSNTGIACQGDDLTIGCPTGSAINILSANYGRTRQDVCPCKGLTKNTNCTLSKTKQIVTDCCEHKTCCSVPTISAALGNPCHNTYKYMQAEYTCVSERVRTCDGNTITLICPYGQVLSIGAVNFGRTLPGTIVCPKFENDLDASFIRCFSDAAKTIVDAQCDGRNQCTLTANSSNLGGDFCPETYKYLDITYSCIIHTAKD